MEVILFVFSFFTVPVGSFYMHAQKATLISLCPPHHRTKINRNYYLNTEENKTISTRKVVLVLWSTFKYCLGRCRYAVYFTSKRFYNLKSLPLMLSFWSEVSKQSFGQILETRTATVYRDRIGASKTGTTMNIQMPLERELANRRS